MTNFMVGDQVGFHQLGRTAYGRVEGVESVSHNDGTDNEDTVVYIRVGETLHEVLDEVVFLVE